MVQRRDLSAAARRGKANRLEFSRAQWRDRRPRGSKRVPDQQDRIHDRTGATQPADALEPRRHGFPGLQESTNDRARTHLALMAAKIFITVELIKMSSCM